MLLVNARAGPSKIHGIGLIAQEFIPKGTRIWEWREGFDLKVSEEQFRQFSPAAQAQVRWYAYYNAAKHLWILSGDDDRFTNHADDANTNDCVEGGNATVASRDIRRGEEITWNYNGRPHPNNEGWFPERQRAEHVHTGTGGTRHE